MKIFTAYNKTKKVFRAFHTEAHHIVFQAKSEKALLKSIRTTLKSKQPHIKVEAQPELEQLDWGVFHSVYANVSLPQDAWEVKEFNPKEVC